MFLLDTNVVSEFRPGKRQPDAAVRTWAARVPVEQQFLSVVSLYELEVGVLSMERRDPSHGASLRKWLNALRVLFAPRLLPITDRIALRCAALQVPDKMPVMDALIAATALEHRLILVTRNVQDFEEHSITLLNPCLFNAESDPGLGA